MRARQFVCVCEQVVCLQALKAQQASTPDAVKQEQQAPSEPEAPDAATDPYDSSMHEALGCLFRDLQWQKLLFNCP